MRVRIGKVSTGDLTEGNDILIGYTDSTFLLVCRWHSLPAVKERTSGVTKWPGNGEGSISRHPKRDLWMVRYTVETPAGTKRKTVYGKTRAEVRDKLAKALADRADGIVFDDENMTVGEYLDGWLKGSVRCSVRDSTYDYYEIVCRKHIASVLGGLKLSKLTAMHVQRFYRDRLDTGLAQVRSTSATRCCTRLSSRPSSGTWCRATSPTP